MRGLAMASLGENGAGPTNEKIVYKMLADTNGKLYVPTAGYNYDAETQNCPFDWDVSIDGTFIDNYFNIGHSGGKLEFTGYTSGTEHEITITPHGTPTYLWARAYGWGSLSSISSNLTEIVYDGSYMGYGVSATDTGGYFRERQYTACKNITSIPEEVLPDTINTIGPCFRREQYNGCSSITNVVPEVLPTGVTTIEDRFRGSIYQNCTSLTTPAAEVLPNSVTTLTTKFRSYQYRGCTNLTTTATEIMSSNVTTTGDEFRAYQYQACINLTTPAAEVIPNSVTSIGNSFRQQQYLECTNLTTTAVEVMSNNITSIGNSFRNQQYRKCTSLTTAAVEVLPDSVTSIGSSFRSNQYNGCTSLYQIPGWKDLSYGGTNYRSSQFSSTASNKIITAIGNVGYSSSNGAGITDSDVSTVYVENSYLSNYINTSNSPWVNITDSKFVGINSAP